MKKKALIIFLLGIIYFTGSTIIDAGSFKTIKNEFNGELVQIYESMSGPEDLDIDRENGLLFISSSDRWTLREGKSAENDGIYLLDIDSGAKPEKIKTDYSGEFHPHGISFLKKDSASFLFVVNHKSKGDFVELFKFEKDQLYHIRTFSDPMMCCPNDLVAVDVDKFYVTNDHGNKDGFMRVLEDYLKIASSYLLYFDGTEYRKAYEGLNYANGVAISNDGQQLYLTHTTGRQMLTFDRKPETGYLDIKSTLELGTGVDNITVDEEGNIWIAAHPKLFSFVEHSKNPAKNSPSELLKVTPHESNTFSIERVFTNDGSQLSGSSVGITYKGEVFIGVVFENKLLRGKLN
jgi:arylesterase/paraoxonase